jgi:hypothetical protein
MRRQPPPGPFVVLVVIKWSEVMPFCASAMMRSQFAAARSAGVRAICARNIARYERISLMYSAALSGVGVGIQVLGIGKPSSPTAASEAFVKSIARWSAAYAESMTSL